MGSWWQCTACLRAQEEDISELQLNHYNLYDVPPDVFIYERTLEKLYLDANRIKDLPRPLFQCHELRVLSLSDNEITNLPPAIASLINLEHLDLSKNSIKELPDNIKECKNLRSIDLSVNPFERFPESITHITGLRELYINDAYIEYLPANFGRLSGLKTLELRENNMMTLPKSMSRLVNLQRLDIGNNDFTELPEVVGDLINLTELWIDGNDIRRIPINIEQLYRLNHFDCTMNSIDTIPSEIQGWRDISIINFSSNEILQLPDTLCYLRTIVTLKIDDNQLNSLPIDIGQMSNLEELIVTKNFLETLPSSIGLLRKLHCLNADNNYLRYLPSEIGSCCSLSLLSLRSNNLTIIPPEVGHLSSLCVFNLVNNCVQFLPVSMLNLTNLKALWLSDNQSQPLVPLQQEFNHEQDMMVLSCFMLPQKQRKPLEQMDHGVGPISGSIVGTGRKICFAAELDIKIPRQLHRAPTPYPKELRNLAKHARNLHHQTIHDQKVHLENQSIIKEAIVAKATPLLNNSTYSSNENGKSVANDKESMENEMYREESETVDPKDDLEECSKPILATEKSLEIREAKCVRNPTSESVCKSPTISDYVSSTWKPDEYSKTNTAKIVVSEKLVDLKTLNYNKCKSTSNKETPVSMSTPTPTLAPAPASTPTPPLEPPPYHIAAAFSKKAALFQQLNQSNNINQEPSYYDNQQNNISSMDNNMNNNINNANSNNNSNSSNNNNSSINSGGDANDFEQSNFDNLKLLSNKNSNNKDEKSSRIPIMREKKIDLSSNNCDNNFISNEKNIYTIQDNNLNIHPTSPITGKKYRNPISNDYNQLKHSDKSNRINSNCFNQNHEQNYSNCYQQIDNSINNNNINNSYNSNDINSECSTPSLLNNDESFYNSEYSKSKNHRIKWMFGPHKNVNVIPIQIKKNPGLGFSISGSFAGNETGIMITKVNPNGPAQGSLRPGDKILEVDGIDLSKSDHNSAVAILKSTGPMVSMMISRSQ